MKYVVLCLLLTCAPACLAEEIIIPVGQQGASGVNLPKKGLSKSEVETAFGSPETQSPAVGQPPISRWEYGAFVVYFEGDVVIHSVLRHQPKAIYQKPTEQ